MLTLWKIRKKSLSKNIPVKIKSSANRYVHYVCMYKSEFASHKKSKPRKSTETCKGKDTP